MKALVGAFSVITNLRMQFGCNFLKHYYQLPRGGGFELVSCPHYLGEAVEWLGWAAMVATPAAAWFATFTAVFLGSRAVATHKWYHDKFREEYPATRRAFIPFLL